MADQNFRVKKGLEVGIGGSIITTNNIGNVGIGTTNPTSKLYVVGDGYYTGVVTATTFNGGLNKDVIAGNGLTGGGTLSSNVTLNVGAGSGIAVNADDIQLKNAGSLTNNYVLKWDGSNTQLTSSNIIDTGTNIGIGTTNPGQPLDVSGNISLNGALYLYNTSRQGLGIWYNPGIGTTNQLTARLGGQDRLTIDSSGNLGLGATPSAWSGIWKSLDFYSSSLSSRNDVLITRLNNNAYNNGTSWIYKNTGVSQSYIQGTSGEHAWYIAPSGTAGAAVTFTQAMTLDASGNLQLGTTTNPDSRRFRVYGISEFDGNGVSLVVYKSSGTKVGSSGQGDYIVSGGPSNGFGIQSETSLVFGTNGTTEKARITGIGSLGINQTDPLGRLHVTSPAITASAPSLGWPVYNAETDAVSRRIYIDTAGNGSVGTASSGATVSLVLGSYYDSRVVITPIGAGGASPSDQSVGSGKDLLIKGGTSDNNVKIGGRLYLSGGSGWSVGPGYNSNYGAVIIQPFGGNLGVGVASPSTKLNVVGIQTTDVNSSTVGPTLISNSTNNVDTTTLQTVLSLQRFGKTGTSYNSQVNFNVGRYNQTGTGGNTQLTLRLTNGTTNDPDTDVMSLWANGNVGIGTINPGGNRLRVNKDLGTNDYISVAQHNSQFQIGRVSDNKSLEFAVLDNGTSVIQSKEVSVGYNNLAIQPSANVLINSLTATGTASQALQVNSGAYFNGNVAIGITNPTSTLHVVGSFYNSISVNSTTTIFEHTGANAPVPFSISKSGFTGTSKDYGILYLDLANNTVGNGSNLHFTLRNSANGLTEYAGLGGIINSNTAGSYSGSLVFYTSNSGVNRNERARIDNLGNFGVNTISPLQRLDVRGNFLLAADGTTANHITQKPYTINNGTLSWEGSAGQLFSITNNLTSGSIFSVNDVSGIPSIDVNADGTVLIAPYNGNVGVGTLTPTAKLDVNGDAKINELTIGKGKGNIFVNVAFGYKTLFSNTTGYSNVAIGYSALYSNTTGQRNVSTGTLALLSNTTGSYNTAIGHITLTNNTTGQENTAIGNQALYSNTTSNGNTAVGKESLTYNTTGYQNTAVGGNALLTNDNGYQNTAVGFEALTSNGVNANTAVGYRALYSNTIGYYNTALGYSALYSNTTANNNIAIGYQTLSTTNTGGSNTAIGHQALYANTTGYNNTAIGYGSGNSCITGTNNTFLGNSAVDTAGGTAASNTIVLGNSSVTTLRCNTSTISGLSDVRDKKDIMDIPLGLSFLNELRPVKFTWNQRDGGRVDLPDSGFIAQEALEVVNKYDAEWFGLVDHQNPEHFELSPGKLIPVLVKAVQELSQQNQELKALIDTITQKN